MVDFSHEQRSRLRRFWLRNYAENFKRLPDDKDIRSLPDLMFGKPLAVIGAAPMAEEAYEALASIKDVVSTVCCDKALPMVLPHFKPDFVCALNTQRTADVKLEEWFEGSEGMKLIVPLTVHPETAKLWKGEVYWMNPTNTDPDLAMRFEQETGLQPWNRGINVGEFAMHMVFGMWYAWRKREDVLSTDPMNYDVVELVDEGERYWTNIIWLSSRTGFMSICKEITTQGMEIFNCSEGGILYHPEYCKKMSPKDFALRWLDAPAAKKAAALLAITKNRNADTDGVSYEGD
jgi:hypothetical protein